MASATLGSRYVVSDEGLSTLAQLVEEPPHDADSEFVSRRADPDRLSTLARRLNRASASSTENR